MNNKPKTIKNNSLPGPLSLLVQAWRLYRRNFKVLTTLSFIASFSTLIDSILSSLEGINIKSAPALVIPITIAAIGISFWGTISMLYAIINEKNKISIEEALVKGLKKLVPYTWLVILSVFIMLGGFILLVVPGIILFVWLYMADFVLIAENTRGMNALLKSTEYIRGYFWSVAGRVLFISMIIQIPFWVFYYIFKLINLPVFLALTFNVFASIIITIFNRTYGFLIYKHLKSIKGEITIRSSSGSKTFFIIFGILGVIIPIVLMILFLMFLFVIPSNFNTAQKSPTTIQIPEDSTVNWKSYTNEKYGYTVKYPTTWSEKLNCEGKGIEGFDYICFFSDDLERGRVSIHAGSTYYFIGLPAEDYCVDKYKEQSYDRQEVIVEGYTAIKCSGSPATTNTLTGIVKDGKIVINFHARYDRDSKKQILSVFDQILSTFKFTDQSNAEGTF